MSDPEQRAEEADPTGSSRATSDGSLPRRGILISIIAGLGDGVVLLFLAAFGTLLKWGAPGGNYAPLAIGFAVLVIAAVIWDKKRRKRPTLRVRGACLKCGYDLSGLAERGNCPECGKSYVIPALIHPGE